MITTPKLPERNLEELRKKAEQSAGLQSPQISADEMDAQRLLHELQVHQIELEMQNEALKCAELDARQAVESLNRSNEELRAANDKLKLTQAQLLQSEKMAAVGLLAAGIAHEINNPVGFVHSNLGVLGEYVVDVLKLLDAYSVAAEEGGATKPSLLAAQQIAAEMDVDYVRIDIVKLLGESKDGLERIKRIVSDLRSFAHVDDAKWQTIDIHACLDSTLNVVWNELKYKAILIKEYGELPQITCLPGQLSQVFMNLMINAVQAISGKGNITLRTGHDADTLWVDVEDTGSGIRTEDLPRIFDPFFTTKPVGSGTGLGLAISYRIVESHKGKIEVRSEVGKGTTFRVILPLRPAALDAVR